MKIEQILTLPESKTLEFKRDLTSIQPILKTLVAFANTAGGVLIIGSDNEGTIVGVNDVLNMEEKLANVVADSISPPLVPDIEIVSVKGHSLLVISVVHWQGPFYLKAKGEAQGTYIRLGSTNRLAGPEIIEELKRMNTKLVFDQCPCIKTNYEDLQVDQIKKLFSKVGKKIDKSTLKTLGILVEYNGRLVCSNGGVILFGKQDIREAYFPNSQVRCARFKGEEKVHFIDQLDIQGTILDAMEEVPKFIERNTKLSAEIKNKHRVNIPEYSPIIIREVLTNALAHADFSLKGMNPKISIFSDKLEIESPGMLPFGYLLEDFYAGISHIRNKVIARVFRELNLMEEWGSGYRRIEYICEKENYPLPSWHEIGPTLRVTLKPHDISLEINQKNDNSATANNQELTVRQEGVIKLLKEKIILTTKELHDQLPFTVAERTLRGDLMTLRKNGIIKMLGRGPSTQWKLS